jgi:hypothetical protein
MVVFEFEKVAWSPGESIKLVNINGRMVSLTRDAYVLETSSNGETYKTPLDDYLQHESVEKVIIDGMERSVLYFKNSSPEESLIECCMWVCFPDFRYEPFQQRENLVASVEESFDRLFEREDLKLFKTLTREEKDELSETFHELYVSVRKETELDTTVKMSANVRRIMENVFANPLRDIFAVIAEVFDEKDFQRTLSNAMIANDILEHIVGKLQFLLSCKTKRRQDEKFVNISTLWLKRLLVSRIGDMTSYPIELLLRMRKCTVTIINKNGKRLKYGKGQRSFVLYGNVSERTGVVGTMDEYGFIPLLE